MNNWKVILGILTLSVTMMSSGYTMLVPFLPMYLLKDMNIPSNEVTMWTGAIFSVTFIISSIMAPIWGKMSDSYGKKPMAIRASFSLAVAYFLGGISTSPLQLFGARVVQGFAAGLWSVCLVITTAIVPMDKLGMSLGILQAGQTSGHFIGPIIGGSMATLFGIKKTFFLSAAIFVFITALIFFFVPEPPKNKEPAKEKQKPKNTNLLKMPIVWEILVYGALAKVVTMLYQPILILYITQMDPDNDKVMFLAGVVFSLVGIASAITAPFWGRWGQRNGFYKEMCLASILAAIVVAFCALPRDILTFGVLIFAYGMFFAGIGPAMNAILTQNTPKEQHGLAFGYLFSADKLGGSVGPLIGGVIATLWSMSSVFYACSVLLIGMAGLVYSLHISKQHQL